MNFVLNDIAVARGFDVKYHLTVQDLSQLARVYPQGWESFINNTFQRFFAVSDMFTAEYVSRMLGGTTVQSVGLSSGSSEGSSYADSSGNTRGYSFTSGGMGQPGSRTTNFNRNDGQSFNENSGTSNTRSVNPAQRPLHTPDEVRRLNEKWQYLFFRGLYPIWCWRPSYWEIFHTLPKHGLKEVMDTIGKRSKSDEEFGYYAYWHADHRLMAPRRAEVRSQPTAPVAVKAHPTTIDSEIQRVPPRKPLSWGWTAAILMLLAILYVIPPWDMPAFLGFAFDRAVTTISDMVTTRPSASAARPAPAQQAAGATASIVRRPPLPNSNALMAMPIAEKTRDYFVTLMDENIDRCAPAHSEQERQMMTYLTKAAIQKRIPPPPQAQSVTDSHQELLSRDLQRLLSNANWSANDRLTAFGTIKNWIRRNYPSDPMIDQTVRRLYANGCPRGVVAEAAYVAPSYADVRTIR
jgi:hypothetical protein